MNHILPILRKDFRRYAWAWIGLLMLGGLHVLLFGTDIGLYDTAWSRMLVFLNGVGFFLVSFFLIVLVVQEESLVDPDAYWLARPLSRLSVLAAKILFCVVVVVGIGVLSEVLTLLFNRGGSRAGYAMAGGFGIFLWVLSQIFLAAQTRSLPRYLVLLVILVVALILLQFFIFMVAFNILGSILDWGILPATLPRHIVVAIQSFFWVTVFLGILIFYYQKRQRLFAWLVLIPAIFAALILVPSDKTGLFWGEWDLDNIELVDGQLERRGTQSSFGVTKVTYGGRVVMPALPTDADIWVSVWTASFTVDGKMLDLEPIDFSQRARRSTKPGQEAIYEFNFFNLEETEVSGEQNQGTFQTMLKVTVSTQVEQARISLADGSGFVHDGNRIRIQGKRRVDERFQVDIGAHMPTYSFEPGVPGDGMEPLNGAYTFALHHRFDGEVYPARMQSHFSGFGSDGAVLQFALPEGFLEQEMELIVYRREISERHTVSLHAREAVLE